MKYTRNKFLFCFLFISTLFAFYFLFSFNVGFSEKDAFLKVYGNYDITHKNALWENMNFPNTEEFNREAWHKKTGTVSQIFFRLLEESGRKKVFFVTKTVPTGEPYDCHACLPIISTVVFVKNKRIWEIESQNLFLMQEGEYAASPIASLIQIGPDKYGITLEYEHRYGEFLAKILYLIVPYKKSVVNALEETIYYDNFNNCGWGPQCATFSSSFNFSKVPGYEFFPLKVKRFGTRDDEQQNYRAVPVDEESTYQFSEGKYIQINWHGFPKLNYQKQLE